MGEVVMTLQEFQKHIDAIFKLSTDLSDGWKMNESDKNIENNKFLTKKRTIRLHDAEEPDLIILATFQYHLVYNISYAVPVLCFDLWKQDGSKISLEEYWKYNENLKDFNMLDTLTQMDHPVLNKPFFTLHPCKTQEILQGFSKSSQNPVISWLSVVGRFVHLEISEEYIKSC